MQQNEILYQWTNKVQEQPPPPPPHHMEMQGNDITKTVTNH